MPTPKSTSNPTPASTPSATSASPPQAFRPIIPVEDVLTGQFQRLHASPDGALWLITDEGVARMQDGTWHVYLTDFTGELVGIDAAGRVWVVSEDTGEISAWDGTSWMTYGIGEGWQPVSLGDSLWRYEPAFGEWTEFAPPEPPVDWTRFGFAHEIALDSSDDPWPAMVLCGASCYGKIVLYRIQDGAWTQIGEALEFGGFLPPHELVVDATGTRWLFWAGSVYRVGEGVSEPVPAWALFATSTWTPTGGCGSW